MRVAEGIRLILVLTAIGMITRCANADDEAFTLYQRSASNVEERIHVATFDAAAGPAVNLANCDKARALFASEPTATRKYWCEKGRYAR